MDAFRSLPPKSKAFNLLWKMRQDADRLTYPYRKGLETFFEMNRVLVKGLENPNNRVARMSNNKNLFWRLQKSLNYYYPIMTPFPGPQYHADFHSSLPPQRSFRRKLLTFAREDSSWQNLLRNHALTFGTMRLCELIDLVPDDLKSQIKDRLSREIQSGSIKRQPVRKP